LIAQPSQKGPLEISQRDERQREHGNFTGQKKKIKPAIRFVGSPVHLRRPDSRI
jgi:hypothetical protein